MHKNIAKMCRPRSSVHASLFGASKARERPRDRCVIEARCSITTPKSWSPGRVCLMVISERWVIVIPVFLRKLRIAYSASEKERNVQRGVKMRGMCFILPYHEITISHRYASLVLQANGYNPWSTISRVWRSRRPTGRLFSAQRKFWGREVNGLEYINS